MDPLQPLCDEEFTARIVALVQDWEENLTLEEPNRQRVFSHYQLLSDASLQLTRWQRSGVASGELGILADRVSACLAFASVVPSRAAALKRHIFSGRSRGCRGGPAPLELEIMESLEARAQQT